MESVVSFGRSEIRSVSTLRRQSLPILMVWSCGQSAWDGENRHTDDVEDEKVVQRVVGDLQRLNGQICSQTPPPPPLASETYLRQGNEGSSARSFESGPLRSSVAASVAVTFISSMRLKDLLKNIKRLEVFSRL